MEHNLNYCPNCHGYYLINELTGEIARLGCNRYDCSHCGRIKTFKFKKALQKYLSSFNKLTLWTFSVRTTTFHNQKHWNRMASEAWRRFTIEIRRDKSLTEYQRNFQYIKVCEFTKRGYIHWHCFFNCYFDMLYLWKKFNIIISRMLGITLRFDENGRLGEQSIMSVNYQQIPNAKRASSYVAKYLIKSCQDLTQRMPQLIGGSRKSVKLWTKSGRIAFFPKKQTVHAWIFLRAGAESLTESIYLDILAITSRDLANKIGEDNELFPKLL